MTEAAPIRIGGRYRVEHQLGKGGMGVVYAAIDEATGQTLAVKQLRPAASRSFPRAALLFEREYHTLTQLRHPHIVEAYDYGVTPEGPFYTMELLDGADLDQVSPREWRSVCHVIRDVATALALLHSRRLVHRDVSTHNVRRTSDDRTKLIDFGAMTSMAISVDLVGTPPFTAPEAYYRQPLDPRVDLFGLGALAYWLLTGHHAFPASNFSELPALWKLCPESPSNLASNVPPALDELVRALLSEKAIARPRSAAEVIERIDALCGEASTADIDVAQGYLLTPTLVGRAREMDELRERLRHTMDGKGSVVAVQGVTGAGRTRLLHELALEAKLHGALSLAVSASSVQQDADGVVRSLLEECRRTLPDAMRDDKLPPEVASFLLESAEGSATKDAADPRERRVRLLSGLATFFSNLSSDRPIVITVDDVHACDDFSISLLASLAADATSRPMLVVVSVTTNTNADVVPRPLAGADRLTLGPLSETDTLQLVHSFFGDVPNVTRLSAWVHDRAQGNVLFILELVQHLCRIGDVRYAGGAWLIAPTFGTAEAPAKLEQAFSARVRALSRDALELAEVCALYDGEIQLSGARDVWTSLRGVEASSGGFFEALDQLAFAELVAIDLGKCSYRQEGLRKAVLQGMSVPRKRELHRNIAQSFLRMEPKTTANKLRAAWHFMQAGDDEAGADLVVEIAQDAGAMQSIGESAVPIIEAAFDTFERLSRPLAIRIHAKRGLLQYAYIYDTRLAKRAASVIDELSAGSGLAFASALDPSIPAAERLSRGMHEAAKQFEATAPNERGLPPPEAMVELIRASFAMMGVAVLWWDLEPITKLEKILEPLSAFGETSGAGVALQCISTLIAAMQGLDRTSAERRLRLLDLLSDPDCFRDIPAEARVHLIATQLHAQGTYESWLYPTRALERAAAIEAQSLKMYEGAALQIRFLVELCRGHAANAEQYRRQIERAALRGSFGRQNELWLVRSTAGLYSMWGDVLALKQTMVDLQEITASYPGYEAFYQNARAAYHRERGDYDVAVEASLRALTLAPPGKHGAWLQAVPIYVDTLVAAGRYADALDFMNDQIAPEPIPGIDYERVEAWLAPPAAVAAAALGDLHGARARLDAYAEKHVRRGESDLFVVRLYESEARIALVTGDAERFMATTQELAEHCRALQNPALMARCERLIETARREKLISSPFASPPSAGRADTRTAAPDVTTTQRGTPTAKRRD